MKRPLLAIGLTFAAATWAHFFFGGAATALSAACAVLGLCVMPLHKKSKAIPVVFLTAAIAFGAQELYIRKNVLPLRAMAGEIVTAQGVVTSSEYNPPVQTFTLLASFPENPRLPDAYINVRSYDGEPEHFAGDTVRCRIRLEELRSSVSYHNSKGVYIGARLLETEPPQESLSVQQGVTRLFLRLRAGMLHNLRRNLPEPYAGVIAAMTLGDSSSLDPDLTRAFNRSGTVHLFSVSGLHLSVMIDCLTRALRALKAPRSLRVFASAAATVAFSLLVGFSPSIVRGMVMTLIVLAGQVFSRRSDTLNSLGASLALICIFAPHWTLSSGFWLSASSTAGIAVLSGPLFDLIAKRFSSRSRLARYLAKIFLGAGAVSVSAYAFSLPFLLLAAGQVTLASPLANVLISPLVAPALICGVLCALVFAGPLPAAAAKACTSVITEISFIISAMPFTNFSLDEVWKLIWLLTAAIIAGFMLCVRADKALRKYGAAMIVLAFAAGGSTFAASERGKIEVVTIERCSAVILLREGAGVVVGAPSVYEIGRLMRYLDFRGVTRLDAVIANDCGEQVGSGLIRLVNQYNAKMVIGPGDAYILEQLASALPGVDVLSAGYATITVLDGANIAASLTSDDVRIIIGQNSIVKSRSEYAIIMDMPPGAVRIWRDGVMVWSRQTPPAFEPVGALLFGERRLVLSCAGA